MAPPQLRGDPCKANLPGLFPTKMAGLRSTSQPSGLFPANYDDGGVAVHFFLTFNFLRAIVHQSLLDNSTNRGTRPQALMRSDFASPARVAIGEPVSEHSGGGDGAGL